RGHRYSDARIEEMPMLSAVPEKVTLHERYVQVWDDGTTSDQVEQVRTEWPFDMLWPERNRPVGWRWVRAPIHNGRGGRLEVWGTSKGRVDKVFSERRAQLLADDAFRARSEARS